MACTIFFFFLVVVFVVVVVLFLPASDSCPTDEWMWCLALFPRHSQVRAVPWLSRWGVSVTPMALSSKSYPMDEWMWCSALFPWHSQTRANPWMSGWGVSITPMALSSDSCPMDEWMCCFALFLLHPPARAVTLLLLLSLPLSFGIPTSWCDLWAQPVSLFVCFFLVHIYFPLSFSVTGTIWLPVCGVSWLVYQDICQPRVDCPCLSAPNLHTQCSC